jgi:ERCC4-type nuclease
VEGTIRPWDDGRLEIIPDSDPLRWVPVIPETSYYRFNQYLDQLSVYCGILVKRSDTVKETAEQVMSLYRMLQCSPEEHKSLNQIYVAPPQGRVTLVRPSLLRRVAYELPGIGWERSGEVARHFGSVREMCTAPVEEWESIEGIGRKTAQGVVDALG